MKIFISWSGQLSQQLAEALKKWVPKVIQAAKPFYSPHDISKGSRRNYDISKELDDAKVGLICLTQDNLESSWIMFEAGALSKNVDSSKVCPILFNVDPSQIVGPLTQFQSTIKFSKDEIYKTLTMLNDELGDLKLKTSDLDEQFEMWWPRLKENVEEILEKTQPISKSKKRQSDEILEEILQLTRSININNNKKDNSSFHPKAVVELTDVFTELVEISIDQNNQTLYRALRKLVIPIKHLIKRSSLRLIEKDEVLTRFYDSTNRLEMLSFTNKSSKDEDNDK